MGINRRKFITIAGLTAITAVSKKALGEDSLLVDKVEETINGKPLSGHRWAMVVDFRKCLSEKGCTKCMDVCHHIHNVPDFGNPKDEIKWIWKDKFEHVFPGQEHEHVAEEFHSAPVLSLCNHCDDPPCVKVCPTQATFKREDGIVMMDMHRCIGCRYCVTGCPYGSRSFNWRDPRPHIKEINKEYPTRSRGVVEKCNFCAERLAKGLMPACTEACPVGAMTFGDLEDSESEVRKLLKEKFTIRRKPNLGTHPEVYYIV